MKLIRNNKFATVICIALLLVIGIGVFYLIRGMYFNEKNHKNITGAREVISRYEDERKHK